MTYIMKKMFKVKNVKIKAQDYEDFKKECLAKTKSAKKEESASFETLEYMRKLITPARIYLLKIIKQKKPNSIYELAKITNRPLKSINRDIDVLKNIGLIELKKIKECRRRIIPIVQYDKINIAIEI